MTLGVVEQPAAGLADEDAAQKAAAGLARTGEDRRHDRPERPALEMVERGAVGVGDEEILVAVRHRPVERQRDLAHAGAYCPPGRELRSVLPDPCTCQPCAWRAACRDADTPPHGTRITQGPP